MSAPSLPERAARLGLDRLGLARTLGRLANIEPPVQTVNHWWYGRRPLGWQMEALLALMERHPEER